MISATFFKKILNLNITILIILIVSYKIVEDSTYFVARFNTDQKFCSACFQQQIAHCSTFLNNSVLNDTLIVRLINVLTTWIRPDKTKRRLLFETSTTNITVIGKYNSNTKRLRQIKGILYSYAELANFFSTDESVDRFQLCAKINIERFVKYFSVETNNSINPKTRNEYNTEFNTTGSYLEHTVLVYMLIHVQPLILPYLYDKGFPVPKTHATCGFSIFQSYVGQSLVMYRTAPFLLKLQIAKQLLEAAIMFSYGFDGFRIYITDMSEDNIVYDALSAKLYFVDLDTIFVVDSSAISNNGIHRHDLIECENCFAYSPDDLCNYKMSDINLFAACQLLRDNMHDSSNGFLQPFPKSHLTEYPQLAGTLDLCVECSPTICEHRFAVATKLIQLLNDFLI